MLYYYLYFSLLYWFFPYLLIICPNLKRKKSTLVFRRHWSNKIKSTFNKRSMKPASYFLGEFTKKSLSWLDRIKLICNWTVIEGRAEPHTAAASSQDLCKPKHWEDHAPSHPRSYRGHSSALCHTEDSSLYMTESRTMAATLTRSFRQLQKKYAHLIEPIPSLNFFFFVNHLQFPFHSTYF